MAVAEVKKVKKNSIDPEVLKEQYGEVFELSVYIGPEDTATAYLKKPTRAILSVVMSKINTDPLLANELLMKNCIIREVSDMRILEDDEIFISAMNSLDGLVNVYKSDLKKI